MASPDALPSSPGSSAPSLSPPTPLYDECYPHLVEWILNLTTDYGTRLAVRALARRFKQAIDSQLFNHVALVVLPFPTYGSTSHKARWRFSMVMRQPYAPFNHLPWLPEHVEPTAATYDEDGQIAVRYDWPEEFTESAFGSTPTSSSTSTSSSSFSSSRWPCPEILDFYGVAPHKADSNSHRHTLPDLRILRDGSAYPYLHSAIRVPCLVTQTPELSSSLPEQFAKFCGPAWSSAAEIQMAHCRWSHQERPLKEWWISGGEGRYKGAETFVYLIPPPPTHLKPWAKDIIVESLKAAMHSNLKDPNPPDVWLVGLENLRAEDETVTRTYLPEFDIDSTTASDSGEEDEDRATIPTIEDQAPFDEAYYHKTAKEIVEQLSHYGRSPRYQTMAEWQSNLDIDPVVLEHKLPMHESEWLDTRLGVDYLLY